MPRPDETSFDAGRHQAIGRLLSLLWLHAAALVIVAFAVAQAPALPPALSEQSRISVAALAAAAAGVATVMRLRGGDARTTAMAVALGFAAMAALSRALLASTGFQSFADIEALACLGVLAACRDWRVLATAAMAMLLFLGGLAGFGWAPGSVLSSMAILLAAAAPAIWLTHRMAVTQAAHDAALASAGDLAARTEQALRDTSEVATDLAAQATESRVAQVLEDEVGGLVSSLVRDAATAANGVRQAIEQISGVTEETARGSVAISAGSQEAWSSAQAVATAVDLLAASIAQVTADLRSVSDTSYQAMGEAGAANETVQHLGDAAVRISKVVRMISRIATRTNLLALNASIEAARAGDAGRGFSVVANEVKELAHQTERATVDIEREIANIHTKMEQAVRVIDGMAGSVANLGSITTAVTTAMEEQSEIARSISAGAMRAAAGTEAVVSNLRVLTDAAARGDAAAQSGAQEAVQLAEKCGSVETAMRDFVRALVAA